MKKLLTGACAAALFFIIASSLPMMCMDMDQSDDRGSKKRPLEGEVEISSAKREKTADPEVDAKKREAALEELIRAIIKSDHLAVEAALAKNPDVETVYTLNKGNSGTALHFAIHQDHISLPIVQALIAYGANPNKETENYFPALAEAIDFLGGPVQLDCVKMLLMAKADPNVTCNRSWESITHLSRVLLSGEIEENTYPLCKMLLEHGADINSQSTLMKDANFVCKYCGKIFGEKGNLYKHIKTHVEKKPLICFKRTPLLTLCHGLQNKIIVSDSSDDVLALITKYEPVALIRLFLGAGADITIKDTNGNSPLSVLSPTSELTHNCEDEECEMDHSTSIRTINRAMLATIQTHIAQQKRDLRTTLQSFGPGLGHLSPLVADYWLGPTSPEEIVASSSAPATTTAITPYGTGILGLDQE